MRPPFLHHARARASLALALVRYAHRRHGTRYPALAVRFHDVYVRRRFSLREIAKLDLLDPGRTPAWLDATASKDALFDVQRRLNPPAYWALTEDKRVFARWCGAAGLPVPPSLGDFVVRGRDGTPAATPLLQAAAAVLAQAGADELIVKPACGCHGEDVHALRRDGRHFVDERGVRRDAEGVVAMLAAASAYEAFVVQARLRGHPALNALSATTNLQTVRMVTYVRRDGTVATGGCQLKIIGGDAFVDNFANGALGNLLADVPAAAGVLSRAFVADADGSSRFVDRHPRSAAAFEGFAIPRWTEARSLVERAALAFLPLRTIGWDVGVTAGGPVLIEGNVSWDPPQRGGLVNGEILDAMRADGEDTGAATRGRDRR